MSHANARLTIHGRFLLVERVIGDHRPVAHVAKELDVSRQCAHRWVKRFRAEAESGLLDRSSRPHRSPSRTSTEQEDGVQMRAGPVEPCHRRPGTNHLADYRPTWPPVPGCLRPVTGALIRATRSTAIRYERQRPGELIHVDVKKLGRIPEGGGWRAHGRSEKVRGRGIGFDYIHAAIDDYTRFAYAQIHPDEKGTTAAAFLLRAAGFFKARGIGKMERIITDNAFAYRNSAAFKAAAAKLGAEQRFIKPLCPWTNGKIERFNRTLAAE